MFFMGWFQVPKETTPKAWDIWCVSFKSPEEMAKEDPASPGVLKEYVTEPGYTNYAMAYARANTLRREYNFLYGFTVRPAGYVWVPNPDPEWNPDQYYYDSGWYPEQLPEDAEDAASYDDGIAQIEAGAGADDPYNPDGPDTDYDPDDGWVYDADADDSDDW